MEDSKRENKPKRSKSEVKNTLALYIQKRNYRSFVTSESTKDQLLKSAAVEQAFERSNSILYSCCNSDPAAIDGNFSKFIIWLKEQIKNKNKCQDLEQIVGPLFCHLYFDILKGGNADKAANFFKNHITSIYRNKCDDSVTNLIQLIGSRSDFDEEKEVFRSKKITIQLSPESLNLLKKFVLDNCHIVFLQVLQTWFNFMGFQQKLEECDDTVKMSSETVILNQKFKALFNAIKELKKEPIPVYNVAVTRSKNEITCGLLKRQCSLVALAENNIVRLMALHSYDTLLNLEEGNVIVKLTEHSERIYAMDISPDNLTFVTGSADRTVCIYNLADMKLTKKCVGHQGPVYCVKISSNNAIVASGSMDTTVRLWECCTGKVLRVLAGHTQSITSIAFHPNCLYIATGSADKNIRMWCINKATCLRLFHASKDTIYALTFDSRGKYIASASDDGRMRIWDLLTSKVVAEMHYKDTRVLKLIWKDEELCAGSADGQVKLWCLKAFYSSKWDGIKNFDVSRTISLGGRLLWLEFAFGSYGGLLYNP